MTQIDRNYENVVESEQVSDKRDWYKNHVLTEEERRKMISEKLKLMELYSYRSENRFYDD